MASSGAHPSRSVPNLGDREKSAAAAAAADLVHDGMVVGLGTGSTAERFLEFLAARVQAGLDIVGVPTSVRTRAMAERLGIPLCLPDDVPSIDLTIDGTDEIDPDLRLIKGAGGALLFEKIVAVASRRMVVIADSSKTVARLGRGMLPVEVVPFGWERTAGVIAEGASKFTSGPVSVTRRGTASAPYRTDSGHYILDCGFDGIPDPARLADFLDGQPGIVEHGLFIGICSAALIGRGEEVQVLGQQPEDNHE